MHIELGWGAKPVAFYPYTSIVQDRIITVDDYYNNEEIKAFKQELIETFRAAGIDAKNDNKIAFEVEVNSTRVFFGFKDWNFSVGLSVSSDSWVKPITKQ